MITGHGLRRAARLPDLRLLALVGALAIAYALYSVLRHRHFQTNAFDLGIFEQIVWHYSRLEAPASSLRGLPNMLADHFHPILVLLAPIYRLAPVPETLLVAQAMLLAASVIPVFLHARDRLGEPLALSMAAAYGLFWGLQKTAAFEFHELAFAPLLVAIAVLAMERRRAALFWSASAALLLVKEELPLVLVGAGLYMLIRGRRTQGLAALGVGLTAFVVLLKVVIPSFAGARGYEYGAAYAELGGDPVRIPLALLADPVGLAQRFVTPLPKLRTVMLWVGPFLFLPLLSPLSVVALPLAATRLLSASPAHWAAHFHYTAPLSPILAMAAADGLARLRGRFPAVARGRVERALVGLILLLCAILPGNLPVWRLFSPRFYRLTEAERAGHRLVALIPDGASVVAQGVIAPHLSRRDTIHMLVPGAPDADYVLAARRFSPWPNPSLEATEALLAAYRARGFAPVFEAEGWLALTRPGAPPLRGSLPGASTAR